MPPSADWNYPTQIRFGAGRIAELADACFTIGIKRPLLITDQKLAELSMVRECITANEATSLPTGLFSDVKSNPTGKTVEKGVTAYREGNHDGIITLGGGSAMDVGKAVALLAGQTTPLWEFEDLGDNWKRADARFIAPIVAVPTTSGTGSETGRAAIITDEAECIKKVIFHPRMMPSAVICDPELVVSLPPRLTAATGMDALAHCLEAYSVSSFHPLADGIALEGMRLISEYLPGAVNDGTNIKARGNMMAAALMGSTAFQKGLGAIHSLSHPVGAVYDVHHGIANAIFMPYVLIFNRSAISEKAILIARHLGLPKPSFNALLDWVLSLRADFSIPHTAQSLGLLESDLDLISGMAANDPTAVTNPVTLDAKAARQLYEQSLTGKL